MLPPADYLRVETAIQNLIEYDSYLLEEAVYERSITFRLALYLQVQFGEDWDVDCEFDKVADTGTKTINVLRSNNRVVKNLTQSHALQLATGIAPPGLTEEIHKQPIYPDIIVHRRGSTAEADNFLVVEAKKEYENADDRIKLIQLTEGVVLENGTTLKYQYGLSLTFRPLIRHSGTIEGRARGRLYTDGQYTLSVPFAFAVQDKSVHGHLRLRIV